MHLDGDAPVGLGEGAVGIAIGEMAHAQLVRARALMDKRRAGRDRGAGIDHGGQRLVLDRDKIGGVFRDIAIPRQHQRHRLADIAHALHRERPLRNALLHRDQERVAELLHLGAGDDMDAAQRQRRRGVDAADQRVRVGRADDMRVERAPIHRQIIDEPPASPQQRAILDPPHRLAEPIVHARECNGRRRACHCEEPKATKQVVLRLGSALHERDCFAALAMTA